MRFDESVSPLSTAPIPTTGLVLAGGGARAAYQVGAMKAITHILESGPDGLNVNPFGIICGTSAGAINAVALGCGAENPRAAVRRLLGIWENITTDRVYRADSVGLFRTGARWLSMLSFGWMLAKLHRIKPRSLLDNEPLSELLTLVMDFGQLERNLADGTLHALAITASSYTSGRHLTFFQSAHGIKPWQRSLRKAIKGQITTDHLLASSAIPFIFPARRIATDNGEEWCGDGAMRQLAPISPAIHLGADRVLVIGAGRMHENPSDEQVPEYPTLAQIAGHAMSNIFLDSLSVDIEQLERTNEAVALMSPEVRAKLGLKPVKVLAFTPTQNIDSIAARHVGELPATMRALLGGIGVSGNGEATRGAGLVSYLLFEPAYTRELIALGWDDVMARRDEVSAFFGVEPSVAGAPSLVSA